MLTSWRNWTLEITTDRAQAPVLLHMLTPGIHLGRTPRSFGQVADVPSARVVRDSVVGEGKYAWDILYLALVCIKYNTIVSVDNEYRSALVEYAILVL